MAYNDDAVLARLSSLNESHDSIATAAQWIMFHRRHAERTVQLWVQRLKDSSNAKRLSLVYLANEVVQQSRIRHKEDFVIAFSPVVAEAAATAYKGSPTEIQSKLRRVVDVWKDRSIFEGPIQEAIEARLDELDKARGSGKPSFGGTPFGSTSIPPEFAPIINAYQKVAKLSSNLRTTISSADQEYEKQMDPNAAVPSAPVYAARLNGLLRTLASAESAVAECVKARESLASGLEKMVDANRAALESDRSASAQLTGRKDEIEEKKQQVEVAIMRALGPADSNNGLLDGNSASSAPEPDRPEIEALTPPTTEMEPADLADGQTAPETSPPKPPDALGLEASPSTELQQNSAPIQVNGSNKRRRIDDDSGGYSAVDGDDGIEVEVSDILKDDTPTS